MEESREESHFNTTDVMPVIKEAIESILGGNTYDVDKVNYWTGQIVEKCLGVLVKMQKPRQYKYVVTATIMQKKGTELHGASMFHWNDDTDGSCTAPWDNETMYCIASVFAVAL